MAHVENRVSSVGRRSGAHSREFRVSKFIGEHFDFLEDEEQLKEEEEEKCEDSVVSGAHVHDVGDLNSNEVEQEQSKNNSEPVAMEIDSEDNWPLANNKQRPDCETTQEDGDTVLDRALEKLRVKEGINGINRSHCFPHSKTLSSQSAKTANRAGFRNSTPPSWRTPMRRKGKKSEDNQSKSLGSDDSDAGGNSPTVKLRANLRRGRSESPGSESVHSRGSDDSEDDDDAGIYAESFRYSSYVFVGDVDPEFDDDVWLPTSKSDTWINANNTSKASSVQRRLKKNPKSGRDSDKSNMGQVDMADKEYNSCECAVEKSRNHEKTDSSQIEGNAEDSRNQSERASRCTCSPSAYFCCRVTGPHKKHEMPCGLGSSHSSLPLPGKQLYESSEGSEVLGYPSVPSTASTSTVSMTEIGDLDVSRDSGLCMENCGNDSKTDDSDAVFLPAPNHIRSDSISTTMSEQEFRDSSGKFLTQRTKVVRRYESTSSATYTRISQRFQDVEVVNLARERKDSTFGFHIIGSEVTTVEPGSVASRSGVKAGTVLLTVNDVGVENASHEEVQQLILQDPMQVKLGFAANKARKISSTPCCGFLTKQGGSGLLKNWRRRWFELKEDNCLYYYKNEFEKDPLGAILLKNYTVTRAPDVNRKHTFKIVKYGQRTYYFQADSEKDMNRWAHDIAMAADAAYKKNETWLDVSSHNVGLPALSIKKPDCHGYLTKMGNRYKSWKRRYCVLKDACLYYYLELSSVTAQGVAHLHGYQVVDSIPQNKKLGFMLAPPETTMRSFTFIADNETDKKRWIEAFESSIAKWVKAGK